MRPNVAQPRALGFYRRRVFLPVPFAPKGTDVDKWLEMASVFCSHVGPLLRDGHVREASGISELVQFRLGPV
jgi:hypothetical protein